MSLEMAELAGQAGQYLAPAVSAYGAAVLTRAESAAADGTANVGRRILRAVWRRRDERGRAELEAAVRDVDEAPDDEDAAAALRQQIKRALRDDAELRAELAGLLPAGGGTVNVTASGERSIAADTITNAVTGDHVTFGGDGRTDA
ncbi:hypothetical protein ABII15_18135 [Streptomyces sp. HUAS MG91]|uniref:Uncharacterized protein n=1 Tax=Streptomyces tabacisoli TaxID=3156398 RepID=A0AAU8IU78_9ACTN